jgi:hypothetical protein
MRKSSGLKHQLVKHAERFECSICNQTWKSRPQTHCPGVKVYPRYNYSPLLTQDQLRYLSYDTSAKHLPAPVGCYYSPGAGVHVYLYDPTQAVKRKTPNTRRITTTITDIYWPLSALSMLNDMSKFMEQRKGQDYQQYVAMSHEIANVAAAFHVFTPAEIEQFSGGCFHLSISPSLIRRLYPLSRANEDEQIKLAAHIVTAYRRSLEASS